MILLICAYHMISIYMIEISKGYVLPLELEPLLNSDDENFI